MNRVGILFLVLVILGIFGVLIFSRTILSAVSVETAKNDLPQLGDGHGPLTIIAPAGTITHSDPGSFTVAQARVYAALGEVADDRREQLPPFDAESRAVIEQMRRLLAAQPQRGGEARPTVSSTGATSTIADTRGPLSSIKVADSLESGGTKSPGELPPVKLADGGRKLELGTTTGTVTTGTDGHVISGRDAWAAIKAKPGQGLPVRITDRGQGGHVIAVFGDDFGTVRVNGGLVVPGRYYLINGSVEITGMVPLGIHIRPLSAVPTYHDQPLMTPSANG